MKVILIPLLAAVAQAASLLITKVGLTRRRIKLHDYIPGLFLFLALVSAASLPWLGNADFDGLLSQVVLIKLGVVIVAAVGWNLCFYIGVSKEKANVAEGIMVTMPLATIGISWLFDWSNFNGQVALAALLATAIVAWAYSFKTNYRFDKYTLLLGVAVLFIGLENVMVAQLLQLNVLSPAALYALRASIVFVIFYLYYRPSLRRLSKGNLIFLAFSAVLGVAMMLLRFYGLRDAGINMTALILILSPAIVMIAAGRLLHERIKMRRILALAFAIGLVIYATLLNYHRLG